MTARTIIQRSCKIRSRIALTYSEGSCIMRGTTEMWDKKQKGASETTLTERRNRKASYVCCDAGGPKPPVFFCRKGTLTIEK